MKVVLARSAGYCWGVKRAVDRVLDAVEDYEGPRDRMGSLGPLIHNKQGLQQITDTGVRVVEDPSQVEGGMLILRTHGATPELREELRRRDLKLVDCTCPHVGRIQGLVRRHHLRGEHVIIIGDRKHAEVIGLVGYAQGQASVIDSVEDVALLRGNGPVAVVCQSTHDRGTFEAITRAIRERFPAVTILDTLCDVTDERQQELVQMAPDLDAMVVIGGRNSANTRRMAQLAEDAGLRTFHIETEEELSALDLAGIERVGVTAGASTPEWVIRNVVETLRGYPAPCSNSSAKR